jgi:arsenite methyltransferase
MSERRGQLTPETIRTAVAEIYGRVASEPAANLPFPVGRAFAESLGYPAPLLDGLPAQAVNAFAGISNPLSRADLHSGERVLDLGCGAGMDTIIAARQVGPAGHVYGLDLSANMLECARANADAASLDNVTFYLTPAEAMPLPDSSVDVAVVNGIFNLCPIKEQVMAEVCRVLRPGGRLLVSEIVIRDEDEADGIGATCRLEAKGLAGLSLESWFQ